MRKSTNFGLLVATLLFMLAVDVPQAMGGTAANCPQEPTRTTIADGQVYAGSNCVINAIGDIDEFVFSAKNGETYQLALSLAGSGWYENICLKLYDPNNNLVKNYPVCTGWGAGGPPAQAIDQPITTTGNYTMVLNETGNHPQQYAVSLERLYPFPPNTQQIPKFGEAINGDIAEPTDSDAFALTVVPTGT